MISKQTMRGVAVWALLAGVAVMVSCAHAQAADEEAAAPAEYTLPPLPYAYDALEPVISEEIMRLHHDKHHAGYVRGLNAALAKMAKARADGDMAAIRSLSRDLAFNGSGHALHTLFWNSMAPGGSRKPQGALARAIDRDFGSFDGLKAQFAAAAKAVEGSGWGILAYEPVGKRLVVLQAQNHQNLSIWGVTPLLCCDVWEHAYYLQYKNDRGGYVDGFLSIVNWPNVEKEYAAAAGR